MRIGTIALAGSAILFVTAAASAGRPAASDPASLVKGRQAAMRMSAGVMMGAKGVIDRGEDVKSQAFPAGALASWAAAIPGMFPEGSNVAPTGALPGVWSDAPGFAAKAEVYRAAAAKLADAAKAGDKAAFAAAFDEVRATCKGCHDTYKKP